MNKLQVKVALLNFKAIVNAYTWATLPFYAMAQRPWLKLRQAKNLGVIKTVDKQGRLIYSRPSKHLNHPFNNYRTIPEIIPLIDRNREAVGIRDVISENVLRDNSGNSIQIDGKVLKKVKLADNYRWLKAGAVLDHVDSIARGLTQLGVKKGDNVMVYLSSDDGLGWFYTCMALLRMGSVTVTLFSTLADSGVVYGINHSDAKYVITSQNLLGKLNKLSPQFEHLQTIVYISNEKTDCSQLVSELREKFTVHSYSEVEAFGNKVPVYDFPLPKAEDLVLIMYTSGTTGNPKGVMITHNQFGETLLNLLRYDEENGFIVFKSIYPGWLLMGHIFGYMMNIGMFISDSKVAFCMQNTMFDSSPSHVNGQVGDLKLIAPEFFVAVPLILERLLKEISRKLNQVSPIAEPIFTYLMDYKIRWTSRGFDTPLINRFVCERIRGQFGGQLKLMVVSSAPLNGRTQALVQAAMNCKVVQAYGSTEMTGTSHILLMNDLSYGTVGVPWHNFKFYLKNWEDGGYSPNDKPHPRGEVVVASVCVGNGYYKMPKETAETFKIDEDGTLWLETGDIGEVLPNGSLRIIDRKKDLTKLSNGEFVSLGKIESTLRNSPFVENICICTDPYRNHVNALISPTRRELVELGQQLLKQNIPFEQLCTDRQIIYYVHQSIKELSKELNLKLREVPVVITLVPEEWSQENNFLTAAMKLKRIPVNNFYKTQVKQMFAESVNM